MAAFVFRYSPMFALHVNLGTSIRNCFLNVVKKIERVGSTRPVAQTTSNWHQLPNYAIIPPSLAIWRAAMMGVLEQPQNSLFHFGVNLDKRIRSNHPLRKVNELNDFHFVYDEAISFYGHNGNCTSTSDPEADYGAPKKVCADCELREQCTRNKSGRTVKRHLRQDELNAMREQLLEENCTGPALGLCI
jgi:hypothetical protein